MVDQARFFRVLQAGPPRWSSCDGQPAARPARLLLAGLSLGSWFWLGTCAMAGDMLDKRAFLQKLRSIDSIYRAGFTLEGTEVVPPPFNALDDPRVPMKWSFTSDGERQGVVHDATEVPHPRFPEPGGLIAGRALPPPDQKRKQSADDSPVLGVITTSVTMFNDVFSALLTTQTNFRKGGDSIVTQTGESHVLMLYPPDQSDLSMPLKQALWCAGRGFSAYIDEITSIDRSPDGLVLVGAKGHESPSAYGSWRLEIDPQASYLVRLGEFTYASDARPAFSIRNRGLKSSGACQYPEGATWTTELDGANQVTEVAYTAARLEFDPILFGRIKGLVKPPYRPNTLVLDHRTNPVEPLRVDSRGRIMKDARSAVGATGGRPASRLSRARVYGLLVLNVGALVLFLYFVHKKKPRDPAND